jgi:methylglutaconyl-CoA hydratase
VYRTRTFLASLRHTFNALATLPIPTISAVHGLALGGGLELALCTTFRVLSSTSFLGLPETRLGIIPGVGGTLRLPRLIGQTRAADLILTGRRIGPVEALGMGLCDRVVDVESGKIKTSIESESGRLSGKTGSAKELVHEAALDMAMEICKGGPVAVNQALWAMKTGNEDKAYEVVLGTKDRIEALVAFGEKRRPKFHGE